MKCGACGYEKRHKTYKVDEVIRYKSGKRKGEIKEVQTKYIEPFENDPEFKELEFKKDVDEFEVRDGLFSRKSVSLYACPMCNTVRIEEGY